MTAVGNKPVCNGGSAPRHDQVGAVGARHCAEADGTVRGPKRGRAYRTWRSVGYFGEQADDVDVTRFALIDTHAGSRVPFDELDRAIALAYGQPNVLARHIVVEVEKRPTAFLRQCNFPGGQDIEIGFR